MSLLQEYLNLISGIFTIQFTFFDTLHFSGIGDGWSLSILDNRVEYEFITEAKKLLGNYESVLVDGSSNVPGNDVAINYSNYSTTYVLGKFLQNIGI